MIEKKVSGIRRLPGATVLPGSEGRRSYPVLTIVCLATLFVATSPTLPGADYYLDPARGSLDNPGTRSEPWSQLAEVLDAGITFQPGDVLVLRSGYHGEAILRGKNAETITIRNQEGDTPRLSGLTIREAQNWRLQGLTITPEDISTYQRRHLIMVGSDSSHIQIVNCRLHSVREASGWSAEEWDTKAASGIRLDGDRCLIRKNHLLNVNFGISVSGPDNVVEYNTIENFCGDGLRGLGDNGIFQYNVVKNCYDVNENHDDGFQSWSVGEEGVGSGVVRNIVLRGNRIINFEDPNQPLRGALQGIGCFDGFFEGWVIENNVVLVDHWHGITLGGARNCRIVNNTVADLNTQRPGPPWIRISDHKNGSPSSGNLVRNNLATAYAIETDAADKDHNATITDQHLWFRNYPERDLRLNRGSPAIDAGTDQLAPPVDIRERERPMDGDGDGQAAWDLGAYEFAPDEAGNTRESE